MFNSCNAALEEPNNKNIELSKTQVNVKYFIIMSMSTLQSYNTVDHFSDLIS